MYKVQTVQLPKDRFSKEEADKWIVENKYKLNFGSKKTQSDAESEQQTHYSYQQKKQKGGAPIFTLTDEVNPNVKVVVQRKNDKYTRPTRAQLRKGDTQKTTA